MEGIVFYLHFPSVSLPLDLLFSTILWTSCSCWLKISIQFVGFAHCLLSVFRLNSVCPNTCEFSVSMNIGSAFVLTSRESWIPNTEIARRICFQLLCRRVLWVQQALRVLHFSPPLESGIILIWQIQNENLRKVTHLYPYSYWRQAQNQSTVFLNIASHGHTTTWFNLII